jgi:DNA-binding transcriptional LysR family regulator
MESRIAFGGIELVSDVFQRCESLMQQGKTHFLLTHAHALVPSTLDSLGFPSITIGMEALMPVSAPDVENQKPLFNLSAHAQTPVPLLAYSAGSGLGRIFRAIKEGALANYAADTVFTADLATVLKTMVLERRGIAWLPTGLIEDELNSGRLVHAADASWDIELQVKLYRQPEIKSSVANALWQAIPAPKKLLQG